MLYFFKLSYGSKFWNNLWNDDIGLYRRVTLTERLAQKLRKHEFLVITRDARLYPKFTS